MATRYWVGGTGNWNATSTTNWSDTSGGASGASAPTSVDDVIFDANSNTLLLPFTVTVTGTSAAPAVCQDFSTGGGGGALDAVMTLTMGATAFLNCHGSLTLPAANLTMSSSGGTINFKATSTGKTVTTNGVSLVNLTLNFDGVGGGWTLGSAITTTNLFVINGSFSTSASNYAITAVRLLSNYSSVRAITLNASTVTVSASGANDPGLDLATSTNLTFSAGTSQINISGLQGLLRGGGNTFYNVSFSSSGGGRFLTGANTFNNLTINPRTVTGVAGFVLSDNQIINGTLTCNSAFSIRRTIINSDIYGTSRTLKVNAASLTNVDFQNITIDPTSTAFPLTGTRLGNLGGNSGITFDVAKTVYWNLVAGGSWSATAWALSSGGAVNANNFPLAQDTAIIENTGLNVAATITMDNPWQVGALDISTRSNAMTFAQITSYNIYGNYSLSSSITLSGNAILTFSGYGVTQLITTALKTLDNPLVFYGLGGTFAFQDALTQGSSRAFTITNGTVQLKASATSTTGLFATSGTNQKFLQSTTPGTQATLTQASSTVNASYLTIQDINATGGATWLAYTDQSNIDAGNVDGWDFGISPVVGGAEYTYTLRSFTQPRRF
jgi:hypothetical protein